MKQRLRKAAAVLALLAGALAGALLLLDSDAVRQRIERQVAARTGGQLRTESLVVRLLPRPHVELRGVTLKVPGAVEGSVAAVEIRPALLPLLAGEFRPALLRIERPVLRVSVAPTGSGDPFAVVRQVVGPAVSVLAREAAGMKIAVREGAIEFLSAGRPALSLSALEGRAQISAAGMDADLSGVADLWQRAEMRSRKHELGAVRAAWEIVLDARTLTATLKEFQLGALARGVTGEIRVPLDGAATAFEIKVAQLDLARLQAAAPAPFSFVPAGILRDLSLGGAWPAGRASLDIGALRADARIESATVAVPAAGILVRNGSGRFRLADGVLQGGELAGELGNSSFSAGSLALDRPEGIRLRSLGAELRTDLADVLAIARRLTEGRPNPAIAAVEALEGRATGAIDYDARRSDSRLKLQLANLDAKVRIRDFPFAVAVKRGELQGAAGVLRARGLAGSVGRSQIRDAQFEVTLGGEAAIRSASGEAVLALGELFPWLRERGALPSALADLESVTGDARVRLARLQGPVAKPAALEFAASVEPSKVTLQSPSLHAPWLLASGKAQIDARRLELKQLAVAAGDTRATLSGSIDDYLGADRRADLQFSQSVLGAQGLAWLRARWPLPEWAVPRTPLEIAEARVRWPGARPEPLVVQGKLRFADDLDAEVDLAWRTGELELKRLRIKDADTDASATLHWRKAEAAEVSFDGKFDHRSFSRLLAHPPSERGAASGSFRASLDLREPARSSAAGALQIAGGGIAIGGQHIDVDGRLEGRQDGLQVDGTLRAKTLAADELTTELARLRESAGAGRQPLWDLPISGRVAISADAISYATRRLEQVAGSIDLAPKRVSIDIARGKLCGIDAQVAAAVTPAGVDANARLKARGLAVADSLPCLARGEFAATGTFDLDAEVATRGAADDLLRGASGKVRFVARGGLLRQEKVIDRVLSEEKVAERLNAGTRKLSAEGFPYREINVAGTIQAGKANLDPAIIDSPDIGMTLRGTIGLADGALDLDGLVAPFDEGRRRGQGGALGGPLVVVPVSIRGSLRDPKVSVNTAAAVGTTLLRLMAAQYLLPLQLINISGADAPSDQNPGGAGTGK